MNGGRSHLFRVCALVVIPSALVTFSVIANFRVLVTFTVALLRYRFVGCMSSLPLLAAAEAGSVCLIDRLANDLNLKLALVGLGVHAGGSGRL